MSTINHYVNLIGWEEILCLMKTNSTYNSNYFCDTISLKFLAKIFNYNVSLVPGPSIVNYVKSLDDCIFLTARATGMNEIVLPFFTCNKEIIKYFSGLNLNNTNIVLGVSSPRQNYIATIIAESKINDFNLYCLGAAIYLDSENSQTNLYWKKFILSSPLRTLKKTFLTVFEICRIIFLKKKRNKFKLFISFLVLSK